MSAPAWIAVAAVGGLGALARFALDGYISARWPEAFPLGTFAVNISGAAALGALAGAALHGDALRIAGSGALGSYTTFSTWMLESHQLGADGSRTLLAVNVGASIAVGLGAVALGRAVGGAF